jgi:drug/metabolite transporter (DMT)-like permease
MTGIIFGLCSMCIYGLLPVFSNRLVREIDPFLFAGITTLLGSLPLLVQLKISGDLTDVFSPRFRTTILLISLAAGIGTLLFFMGTSMTSAINTGLLEQSEPIYSMILGAILLKEKIGKHQLIATVLMISGAVLVVFQGSTPINLGDILVLSGPLFFQIAHLFAKQILPLVSHTNVVPAGRLLYGGIGLTLIAAIIRPESFELLLDGEIWLKMILFAIIFRSLDLYCWYQALARLPLAKLSALLPVGAAVSFTGAVFILGEQAEARQWGGMLVILIGLLLISKNSGK